MLRKCEAPKNRFIWLYFHEVSLSSWLQDYTLVHQSLSSIRWPRFRIGNCSQGLVAQDLSDCQLVYDVLWTIKTQFWSYYTGYLHARAAGTLLQCSLEQQVEYKYLFSCLVKSRVLKSVELNSCHILEADTSFIWEFDCETLAMGVFPDRDKPPWTPPSYCNADLRPETLFAINKSLHCNIFAQPAPDKCVVPRRLTSDWVFRDF